MLTLSGQSHEYRNARALKGAIRPIPVNACREFASVGPAGGRGRPMRTRRCPHGDRVRSVINCAIFGVVSEDGTPGYIAGGHK